jgi:hypothetical protein
MSRWVSCWRARIPLERADYLPRMPPHDSARHTVHSRGGGAVLSDLARQTVAIERMKHGELQHRSQQTPAAGDTISRK